MLNYILTYLNPQYWIQLHPYSPATEALIQEILSDPNPIITDYDGYTVSVNNHLFWVNNIPYAVGTYPSQTRAKRHTTRKFLKMLERHFLSNDVQKHLPKNWYLQVSKNMV